MRRSFLIWLISFATTAVVIVSLIFGYFTAKDGIAKYIDVKNNKTDIPYNGKTPQDFAIKLSLPDKEGVVLYFDFQNKEIDVSAAGFGKDTSSGAKEYTVDISYEVFGELADKIGGIDITDGEEKVRITGITAQEKTRNGGEEAEAVMNAFVSALCKNGLTKSNLIFVFDNCEKTDISLVELYPYKDHIVEMLKNVKVKT